MRWIFRLISCGLLASFFLTPAAAQLRGHGGPVRALAVSIDGLTLLSGSFDTAVIQWSLAGSTAERVLRFHSGAVNAVTFLGGGSEATAGADGRIAIWQPGSPVPARILEGHSAPIAALALSPDGKVLASGSWDRTIRLWPLQGGPPSILEGHQQNVNGVAFLPDGSAVVSGGYDATIRIWSLRDQSAPRVVSLPAPLNAVSVAPDGEIIAAGSDGKAYLVSARGALRGSIDAAPRALTALAISDDGALIAAANIGGVAVLDRNVGKRLRDLAATSAPVWAVAFLPGKRTLLTGSGDGVIRRWNADTGESLDGNSGDARLDPLAAYADDPGAQVFRACIACHTLNSNDGERAGPTLHGIFGRKIATLPGYPYSEALKHLDIVWTPESVAELFELGPATFTPGTKMPEQRIGRAEDRTALVKFLERATR